MRALLGSALFVCAAVSFAETARVARVLDGDSLRLTDGRELRLIGINAPEHGQDGRPDEPLAREARALLKHLVEGKTIGVTYDLERQDRYRRTLVHATLNDGTSVQQAMLRAGLAFAVAIPPNLAQLDDHQRAEAEARREQRGVWAHQYFAPRAAAQLGAADTGFRFVRGRIARIGRGRHSIYLALDDRFALAIALADWHYFGGDPEHLVGREVVARGWVSAHENRLRLRLSHPAMWELSD
jgi:endonuclease YncB( thermonuclease family)